MDLASAFVFDILPAFLAHPSSIDHDVPAAHVAFLQSVGLHLSPDISWSRISDGDDLEQILLSKEHGHNVFWLE